MRIVGGNLKGRKFYHSVDRVRPTSNRVKEALFSMVEVKDKFILDLFAGTGALAFESLSRGAKNVCLVDISYESIKQISKSIDLLKISDFCSIIKSPADRAINLLSKKMKKFDIIFIDPPYFFDGYKDIVTNIINSDILSLNSKIIIERSHKREINIDVPCLEHIQNKRYGDTAIDILRRIEI